jgi:hypothetical protein
VNREPHSEPGAVRVRPSAKPCLEPAMLVRILRNAIVADRGRERQFLAGQEVTITRDTAGRLERVGAVAPVPAKPQTPAPDSAPAPAPRRRRVSAKTP